MAERIIVVVGATGVLGGAVVKHFSHLKGYQVRAITRDTESPGARTFREQNPEVELVQASLDDEESLYHAFQGAYATFTPTYYWKIVAMSRVRDTAEEESAGLHEAARAHESQQYRNLFNALARTLNDQEAAGQIILDRIILSALPNPRNYPLAYHFASKANGIAQLAHLTGQGLPGFQKLVDRASYLYIGVYLDSFFSKSYLTVDGRHLIGPQKQPDGSFLFRQVAHPPYHSLPMIYAKTDLGPLVEALICRAPAGTHLLGGQPLTLEEFAMKWGHALGVPVKWEGIGVEEMVSEFPRSAQSFVRTASHAAAFVTEYGFDGGLGAKWPSELAIQPGELIDVEQWVKQGDWSRWL